MARYEETSIQREKRSDATLALPASPQRHNRRLEQRRGQQKKLRRMARGSVFSPAWLSAPWNSPVIGYAAALFLPVALACLTWFLLRIFPLYALPGILPLLATLVVALLWGSGPGLLATLMGALLLNVIVFRPVLIWDLSLVQSLLETIMFLLAGGLISLIVSRIAYAHEQVSRERAVASARARELSILFEAKGTRQQTSGLEKTR